MQDIKDTLKDKFSKEIDSLDLSADMHTIDLKLHSVLEELIEKVKIAKERKSVPLSKTSNENNYGLEVEMCSGKSNDTLLNDSPSINIKKSNSNEPSTIPNNFSLTFEMTQFAKSKFIQDVEEVFENFVLYYQSKGTVNSDWEAVWKRWVLNQNRYSNHLIKTTIDENYNLNNNLKKIAKKHIPADAIDMEFRKFKNHYLANGDLKVSWDRVWENWCINHKQFKPRELSSKNEEKLKYKWDFRKAKDVSDRIKDWLEFDKGINWLDDYYWKGVPIPGIGWQKVMHPDFNKEEILLYKIDSTDGQFMLNHKSNDIIDAEVLEND